jgi:uncharacterized integral membrane protein
MPDEFAAKLTNFINKTASLNSNNTISVNMNGDTSRFDFSLIVIWLIAILTVVLGALWTKHEFYLTLNKQSEGSDAAKIESNENLVNNNNNSANQTLNDSNRDESAKEAKKLSKDKKNEENENRQLSTITIGYLSIFILLLFVVGILLLLYFFYKVMSKCTEIFCI